MRVPLVLSGLSKDLPPWRVPPEMWTDARGIHFRNDLAERVLGSQYIYGTANTGPVHLLNSFLDGTNYWLYAGKGNIGVVDAAEIHSDITPAAWSSPDTGMPDGWTSTTLNGVPILNYQDEIPLFWDRDTANPMQELPGWPVGARCKSMRAFKDFLLAISYNDGVDNFPDQLVWSDAADPGTVPTEWTPTAENLAGDLSFGDTPGELIDGAPLRGSFILYKQNTTYILQYVGGQFVFSRRKLFTTSGVIARNCIAERDGHHIVLTDSDVIIHDGQQLRSLIDTKTRRFIFENLNQAAADACFVFNYKSRNEVWICFPTGSETYANAAVVWDAEHNQLSVRDLVSSLGGFPYIGYGNLTYNQNAKPWDSQAYEWDSAQAAVPWNDNEVAAAIQGGLAADFYEPGFIYLDVGETAATGSIQATLERRSLDFGDANRVKLVQSVWPRIDGADGTVVNIRVGGQFDTDAPIQWGPYQPFTIGTDRKIDSLVQGRYLSFEFSSTDGGLWRLPGFDVELAESGGMY